MRLYFPTPLSSPKVINPSILFTFQAFNDFTAAATSADAIFSQVNLSWLSVSLSSVTISYSFLETSRLISAYCSFVISAFFQCGPRADLTILLMPSLASVVMFARAGDIAGERADGCVGLLGRGCLSSRVGRSWIEVSLFSGGDR